jgi:hypothetical protein
MLIVTFIADPSCSLMLATPLGAAIYREFAREPSATGGSPASTGRTL